VVQADEGRFGATVPGIDRTGDVQGVDRPPLVADADGYALRQAGIAVGNLVHFIVVLVQGAVAGAQDAGVAAAGLTDGRSNLGPGQGPHVGPFDLVVHPQLLEAGGIFWPEQDVDLDPVQNPLGAGDAR